MKKLSLLGFTALTLLAANVFAQTPGGAPDGMMPAPGHDWTLEEARKAAHAHADKLDKMTPAEFAEHQKKRHEFMDKWKAMTPEQKEAFKKERKAKWEARKAGATPAAPAQ